MKDLKDLPQIGAQIMVWPAQRTVRDEKKKPVVDAKTGKVQTTTARVRDVRGTLITSPIPVQVNAYYYKLMVNGNLEWSTKAAYQAALVAKAKTAGKPASTPEAAAPQAGASETTATAPAETTATAPADTQAAQPGTSSATPTQQADTAVQEPPSAQQPTAADPDLAATHQPATQA